MIKSCINVLNENADFILKSRSQMKSIEMIKFGLIKAIELKIKEKKSPLEAKMKTMKKLENQKLEAIKAKELGEFVEI